MGTSKSQPGFQAARFIFRLLLKPEHRGAVLAAGVAIVGFVGALYAWQQFGAPAMRTADYVVTPDNIIVTPQPTWIHSPVKTEVLRLAGTARLDLRDPKLVENLARAFALHPWVAKVIRVEKRFPAQIRVDVQYRRPVLAVKLDAHGQKDLLFLDEASVLLPSADFAPSQAKNYLRVLAAGEIPSGVYGSPWGSDRMAGAARIAAAWQDRWQPLGLYWLLATRSTAGDFLYELRTQDDKARIVWGPALGHESPGDPTPEQKIAALEQFVRDKGPLDRDGTPPVIDLRELVAGGPPTARRGRTLNR